MNIHNNTCIWTQDISKKWMFHTGHKDWPYIEFVSHGQPRKRYRKIVETGICQHCKKNVIVQ